MRDLHHLFHFYAFRSHIVQRNLSDSQDYFDKLQSKEEIQKLFGYKITLQEDNSKQEITTSSDLHFFSTSLHNSFHFQQTLKSYIKQ